MRPASLTALALPPVLASWRDADTGTLVHRLSEGPEPAAPLYFTRPCWTANGRWFLYLRQVDGVQELYAADRAGAVRRITDLPPVPAVPRFVRHMHRVFLAGEIDRLMLRLPAVHPTLPLIAYAWRNRVRLVDLDSGVEEELHVFGPEHSQQPTTGVHAVFTADGRDLMLDNAFRQRR